MVKFYQKLYHLGTVAVPASLLWGASGGDPRPPARHPPLLLRSPRCRLREPTAKLARPSWMAAAGLVPFLPSISFLSQRSWRAERRIWSSRRWAAVLVQPHSLQIRRSVGENRSSRARSSPSPSVMCLSCEVVALARFGSCVLVAVSCWLRDCPCRLVGARNLAVVGRP